VTTGIVKWFSASKDFGFIRPEDGGQDVHIRAVNRSGFTSLTEGVRISYAIVANRNGRSSAENLRI
jgi:cold shock protein